MKNEISAELLRAVQLYDANQLEKQGLGDPEAKFRAEWKNHIKNVVVPALAETATFLEQRWLGGSTVGGEAKVSLLLRKLASPVAAGQPPSITFESDVPGKLIIVRTIALATEKTERYPMDHLTEDWIQSMVAKFVHAIAADSASIHQ